jgi:L-asparaginase II
VDSIVVKVVRGHVVEARHHVHAVAVSDERVEVTVGDPGLVTYFRSSAKPIQALPLVRLRAGLDDAEIAIASACPTSIDRSRSRRSSLAREGRCDGGRSRVRPRSRRSSSTIARASTRECFFCAERAAGRSPATDCRSTPASARCSRRCVRRPTSTRPRFREQRTAAASSPARFPSSGWRLRTRACRSWRAVHVSSRCRRGLN